MISAIVLTKNEENNIKDCLDTLLWCDEILVIDDDSTDETVKIAEKDGAKVIKHALNGDFAFQRNFALSKAKGDWVLFVDADERVSPELKEEIEEKIGEDRGVNGYYLKRIDNFLGRFLKFGEIGGVGGFGGVKLLRLAKRNAGKFERKVDETWQIESETEILNNPLLHFPHPTLKEFLESINERSTMNAEVFFEEGKTLNLIEWLKPIGKFIDNYFFKLGFLDGTAGLVFAVLMSLHSFLVRGKLYLLIKKGKKKQGGKKDKAINILFILWAVFVTGSYLFFLFERGFSKWSSWHF